MCKSELLVFPLKLLTLLSSPAQQVDAMLLVAQAQNPWGRH